MQRLLPRRAFGVLTGLGALAMGSLPLIPGHDVPQHLAYVRLLRAWQENPASYPPYYTQPDTSSGYATIYLVLARLARISILSSPELALRFLLIAYLVALSFAIRALVRATWGKENDEAALLGPLAAFNPVFCMGLIAYLVALPPLVACVAAIADGRRRALAAAAFFALVTGAFHSVAGAALVLFALALAIARRAPTSFAIVTLSTWLGTRLAGGNAALPAGIFPKLVANVRIYGLVDGSFGTFRVSFTHWVEKLDQVAAALVGPFPHGIKLLAAAILVGAIAYRPRGRTATAAPGVRAACALLGIAAVLAPAAIQVPDDLSLLDFRLITTAVILAIATLPPQRLAVERLPIAVGLLLLVWTRQLRGAAAEVGRSVHVVAGLGPSDRVLALSMHDSSAYLDGRNSILHYAAVYHTVLSGGVTSLFWANFSPRLPIGYRADREPSRPPDWAPWLVTEAQLGDYTHVVVRWPHDDDEPEMYELEARIRSWQARGDLLPVASDGDCALFSLTKAPRLSASFVGP